MIQAIQRPIQIFCGSAGGCLKKSVVTIQELVRKIVNVVTVFFKQLFHRTTSQATPIRLPVPVNQLPNPVFNIVPIQPQMVNGNIGVVQEVLNPVQIAPQQPGSEAATQTPVLEQLRACLNLRDLNKAERIIEENAQAIPDAGIFNTLWDEFPNKRWNIFDLAKYWASSRTVSQDPQHMYAPIFTELNARRDRLMGRVDDNIVLAKYNWAATEMYDKYAYIYKFLLTFQELSRPANLELIERVMDTLDVGDSERSKSYELARCISKMRSLYHRERDMNKRVAPDSKKKIRDGVGALIQIFNTVKDLAPGMPGLMDRFFNEAFDLNALCFDKRVTILGTFAALIGWHEDFKIVVPDRFVNRIEEARAFAYFNPFKHRQILAYVAQKAGDEDVITDNNLMTKYHNHREAYITLRDKLVERGKRANNPPDEDVANLYNDFITREAFNVFLKNEKMGQDVLPEYVWNDLATVPSAAERNIRNGRISQGVLAPYFDLP